MWLIVLLLLLVVLYLVWKIQQLTSWMKLFHEAVLAQFEKCACEQDKSWPPPGPPPFP